MAGKVAEGFDAAIPPELEGERSESEPPAGTPRPGQNRGTSPRLPALKNGQPRCASPKLTPKARSPRDLSRSPRQVTPRGAGNREVRQASFTPTLERLQRGSSTPAIERPKDNSDLRQARVPVPRSPHGSPQDLRPRVAPTQVPKVSVGLPNRVRASFAARMEDILQPMPKGVVPARKQPPRSFDGDEEVDVDLDEIKFGEAIGAGSFGAVHKAVYRDQVVAVKQCKCGDPSDAAMLQDEIRYLQKLQHPRLVSFVGSCSKPPHVFVILEYMAGGSLSNVLFVKKIRLDLLQRASMGLQVCEGLTYLHENNVVHRDLKTMNIVLDQQLNCKICDFGLTVTLERTHITIHALQGSPRYMAPEQFSKDAKITEKVDIWQMGCVFMELFCQIVPFSSCKSLEHVATELLVKKRPPSIPSDADPRARILIVACLRVQSDKRPSAAALTDVLELVLAQQ